MKSYLILISLLIAFTSSCSQRDTSKKTVFAMPEIAVKAADFESLIDGKEVKLFDLQNKNGMIVQITNFGAAIVSILLPSKDGKYIDVALGYSSLEQYTKGGMNAGFVVGRYANRIG